MYGFLPASFPGSFPGPGRRPAAAAQLALLVAEVPAAGPTGALPLAHREIDSVATYEALSTPAGDLVANGRVAKFLVDLRQPAEPGGLLRERQLHQGR